MGRSQATRFAKQVIFLSKISTGKAAVTLPTSITNLKLQFKTLNKYGHMGARKFWRDHLPTLQFHNPSLKIEVFRTKIENKSEEAHKNEPAILSFTIGDKVQDIDIKNMHSDEILERLVTATGAVPANMKSNEKYVLERPDYKVKLNA
ncbi:hypothetical protein V1511DRAFT_476700 [Dipodascopsis uninucleata]